RPKHLQPGTGGRGKNHRGNQGRASASRRHPGSGPAGTDRPQPGRGEQPAVRPGGPECQGRGDMERRRRRRYISRGIETGDPGKGRGNRPERPNRSGNAHPPGSAGGPGGKPVAMEPPETASGVESPPVDSARGSGRSPTGGGGTSASPSRPPIHPPDSARGKPHLWSRPSLPGVHSPSGSGAGRNGEFLCEGPVTDAIRGIRTAKRPV